jgi:FMN phosphatase YigB (HAD superfamily)
MLTVLVVSGGGFQGLGLLSALRTLHPVRAVVADLYADSPGLYLADAYHQVPPVASGSEFEDAIARIAEAEGVRLVLPATAIELDALARLAPRLEAMGVAVAVSSADVLRLAADKRLLYAELGARGFPVLPLVDPQQADAPFPLIGKPAGGWGSRGVVIARDAAALARDWSKHLADGYVWQRRLDPCRELSVDFAIDFAGRASAPGVRLRVRTSGGFAIVTDTTESKPVMRWTDEFIAWARGLGGRGAFNLQFLEQGGGVWLSDVNPRFGTSAVHWRGTAHDPVRHLCRSVDPSVTAPPRPAPPRTIRVLGEVAVGEDADAAESAVRAVVFDLDDTLVPQKQWMVAKLALLWDAEQASLPARDEFMAAALRIVEEGPRSTLLDQMGTLFGWETALTGRLIAAYRAVAPSQCALHPDVLPALATLRGKGYRLGLLTDNPPTSQRQKLETTGLASSFDAVVFSREAGGDKPQARAFAAIAEALAMPPAALAMVGDNPYGDGLGALSAGFGAAYVVARAGGFYNFDPALASGLAGGRRLRFVSGLREVASRLPGPRR